MRYYDLFEGANSKCIVIDVQPEYTGPYGYSEIPWIEDLMNWLNRQGQILMFINAEDTGLTNDTIQDVKLYWNEYGFSPNKWNQTEIVDKGYGYLRDWMDYNTYHGMSNSSDKLIIQTIREMYNQRVDTSSELFNGDQDHQMKFYNSLGGDDDEYFIESDISINWISVGQLKKYNGAYLMGGGRNECLKEVTLLMNAFNIKYKLVQDFIYG